MAKLHELIARGTLAARPASANTGALYFATDVLQLHQWDGAAWVDYGTAGAQGPAGPAGAAGAAGAPGAAGPTGPAGGMVDPLTTLGDILVRGAAAPERLPLGADGYVLTVDTADPLRVVWSDPIGSVGPTGPAGPAGATGATGATGPAGPGIAGSLVTANVVFPAIAAGQSVDLVIDFDYDIAGVTIVANASGSVVFNVARATYAAFPTFTDIDGSAPPTLAAAQKARDVTLTSWTVAGAPGDILRVSVVSVATLTAATVALMLARV